MTDFATTFAANMRSRRREIELSQPDLAGLVGVHPNTIRNIEKGRAEPSLPLAGEIAAALRTTLTALLAGEQVGDGVGTVGG